VLSTMHCVTRSTSNLMKAGKKTFHTGKHDHRMFDEIGSVTYIMKIMYM
jgi:hypothetical protein